MAAHDDVSRPDLPESRRERFRDAVWKDFDAGRVASLESHLRRFPGGEVARTVLGEGFDGPRVRDFYAAYARRSVKGGTASPTGRGISRRSATPR